MWTRIEFKFEFELNSHGTENGGEVNSESALGQQASVRVCLRMVVYTRASLLVDRWLCLVHLVLYL